MSPLLIGGGILLVLVIFLVSIYNNLVRYRENRKNAFADIDVQLKQRHDLIPQLLSSVKGYMAHEKELMESLTRARTNAMGATTINDKIDAENQLTSALSGLKIAVEAYPDLKANQNVMQLQEEISDIENKLSAVRRYFNAATKELNVAVQSFPSSIVASIFGFKQEKMFDLGSQREKLEEAPTIEF